MITDLKLHYEDQLEKLRSDLTKERSKNRKYLNFIAQRGGNSGVNTTTQEINLLSQSGLEFSQLALNQQLMTQQLT